MSGVKHDREDRWLASLLGEFVGTYFLVLTVGCNVINDSVGAALSIGAVLMGMVYTIGPVSGAHLNPAVTAAVILAGLLRDAERDRGVLKYLVYIPMQLLGGFLAGVSYYLITASTFSLEPVGRYSWETAMTLEALYTAALVYVVLGVTSTALKGNHFSGLSIGFTVTASAFAIGGISGCSLNPAVSFGASMANGLTSGFGTAMHYFPMYFVAPFVGSFLGVGMFALVFPSELTDD
eukprot:TRINITY_DN4300_c0_g1_i1.p1 TRINITY_DN4300_c0_g1~~TRINITY_DN4300_c0_g1_i1.p1  ORF type:complete len:276 (-),score=24.19 TRINITY_DN4300_c0_g1_i1:155-862(-)